VSRQPRDLARDALVRSLTVERFTPNPETVRRQEARVHLAELEAAANLYDLADALGLEGDRDD
jgi:hypothetical protein